MAGQNFQLVMQTGPNQDKSTPLEKNEVFLGRDLGNDLVINDPEVSRRHARLIKQAGGFVIEDMGSTNGTAVNGQRLIGPHLLRDGDVVTLGEHISLVFEQVNFDPDATIASPPARVTIADEEPLPSVPIHSFPATPSYTGQVPAGPIEEPEVPPRSPAVWVGAVLLALLVVGCVCGAVLFYIDANFLWCDVFPFIPGCP